MLRMVGTTRETEEDATTMIKVLHRLTKYLNNIRTTNENLINNRSYYEPDDGTQEWNIEEGLEEEDEDKFFSRMNRVFGIE